MLSLQSNILYHTTVQQKGWYFQNERHFGNFHRKLQLPYKCDSSNVTATLHHGVLKVTLPIVDRFAVGELGQGDKSSKRRKIKLGEQAEGEPTQEQQQTGPKKA